MPTGDGIIIATPEDTLSQRKIAFELGAKYRIENRFTAAGGGALNVALAASRAGVRAAPYALVGGDGAGAWIRDTLVKSGVATDFLRQVNAAQTDLSVILVDRKTGERVIFVNRDLQETLRIDTAAIPDGITLFVSALSGAWRENYDAIRAAVEERGCVLAYNPGQSNLDEDMDAVHAMIAHAHYIFVNKDEAMQIVAHDAAHDPSRLRDASYLLAWFHARGVRVVAITAGRDGAYVSADGAAHFVASSGARPVDATGAGDAFTGAALAAFLHGEDVRTACLWGAVNAESVVQQYGSNAGLLSLRDLRARAAAIDGRCTSLAM